MKNYASIIFATTLVVIATIGYFALAISNLPNTATATLTHSLPELPQPNIDLPHNSAVAIDGQIIASSPDVQPSPTASTAKMILALALRDKLPDDPRDITITLNQQDVHRYLHEAATGGSRTHVAADQEISLYDALAAILIRSSNNLSDSLVDHIFGDQDSYRAHATDLLQSLEITDTTIGIDASGRHPSTTSTASSLAIIGYHLLQDPILAEIVSLTELYIPDTGIIRNTNRLLGTNNISGIKTGTTNECLFCFVLGATHEGRTITMAVLGAPTRYRIFEDSLALLQSTQRTLLPTTILNAGTTIGFYNTWWGGHSPITTTEPLKIAAWHDPEAAISLYAPELSPGTSYASGTITVTINGISHSVPTQVDSIPELPFWQKLLQVAGISR